MCDAYTATLLEYPYIVPVLADSLKASCNDFHSHMKKTAALLFFLKYFTNAQVSRPLNGCLQP